jgi:hypothetical protein
MKKTSLREHMRQLSKKGVEARRQKREAAVAAREWPAWPLLDAQGQPRAIASPEDCTTVMNWAMTMLATGRLTWHEAHELTVASNAWISAYKEGTAAQERWELKVLLEDIQAKTAAATGKRKAPGVEAMREMARTLTSREGASDGTKRDKGPARPALPAGGQGAGPAGRQRAGATRPAGTTGGDARPAAGGQREAERHRVGDAGVTAAPTGPLSPEDLQRVYREAGIATEDAPNPSAPVPESPGPVTLLPGEDGVS